MNVRFPMMTKTEQIYEYLKEKSPEAILYDNCDSALIGTARLYRDEQWVELAIYSYEALVEHFKEEFSHDEDTSQDEAEEQAMEWVDYNIAGGYLGIYTPLIIND
jgi:glutathione S-transferase